MNNLYYYKRRLRSFTLFGACALNTRVDSTCLTPKWNKVNTLNVCITNVTTYIIARWH